MGRSRKLLFLGVALIPFGIACNGIIGLSDYQYGECPGARCGDSGFDDRDNFVPDNFVPPDNFIPDSGPGTQPVSWAQWPMPNYDGGPAPSTSYMDNVTSVKDTLTGLVWQKNVLPAQMTYTDASKACDTLNANGDKWRLPKRIELVTLVDYSRGDDDKVAMIGAVFTSFPVASVWTSSEFRDVNGATGQYWTVDFRKGVVEKRSPSTLLNVLCVKAGS